MPDRKFFLKDSSRGRRVFDGRKTEGGRWVEILSEFISMSQLKSGEYGRILHIGLEDTMRRRLQDIGMIPGTQVECVGVSPLGDPVAYWIRGAVVALRKSESSEIQLRRSRGDGAWK